MSWVLVIIVLVLIFYIYVLHNDQRLSVIPLRALAVSPHRWTRESVLLTAKRYAEKGEPSLDFPPRTGRRYIVVGGGGFLGGWIVAHLLKRGENPCSIRVLDMNPPKRKDVFTGAGKDIQYFKVDISDPEALEAAFKAPWPTGTDEETPSSPEITVFHTAANIRFYERHVKFMPRSYGVNVLGTQNVINSCLSVGATVLIFTSSGSISVQRSSILLSPWQSEPSFFVQVADDQGSAFEPKCHEEFFSNYAASKAEAERLVRAADGIPLGEKVLRTGCIRPGNGIFGPGDFMFEYYFRRKVNPTWANHYIQSCIYVENCVEAHLLYEKRLLEAMAGGSAQSGLDIGGDCFIVTDPNPPPTYGDVYQALETLTDGQVSFPRISATAMLFLAYVTETYHHFQHHLSKLQVSLPPLKGDLLHFQPSMLALMSVHLIFDDSRARCSPERGGLGYKGAWTTLEGLCKTVEEYKMSNGEGRQPLPN